MLFFFLLCILKISIFFLNELFEIAPNPGLFFSSSASDAEFDAVVGYLEDIIMGKRPCHNLTCGLFSS